MASLTSRNYHSNETLSTVSSGSTTSNSHDLEAGSDAGGGDSPSLSIGGDNPRRRRQRRPWEGIRPGRREFKSRHIQMMGLGTAPTILLI